jgi:hypothetical protein
MLAMEDLCLSYHSAVMLRVRAGELSLVLLRRGRSKDILEVQVYKFYPNLHLKQAHMLVGYRLGSRRRCLSLQLLRLSMRLKTNPFLSDLLEEGLEPCPLVIRLKWLGRIAYTGVQHQLHSIRAFSFLPSCLLVNLLRRSQIGRGHRGALQTCIPDNNEPSPLAHLKGGLEL